jgi:ubiquinol-cytochrome c reductase cytochrome b subunit
MLAVLVVSFLSLGYLGLQPPTETRATLAQLFTILYFAFFLSMPFYSRNERTKPVPTRVTP